MISEECKPILITVFNIGHFFRVNPLYSPDKRRIKVSTHLAPFVGLMATGLIAFIGSILSFPNFLYEQPILMTTILLRVILGLTLFQLYLLVFTLMSESELKTMAYLLSEILKLDRLFTRKPIILWETNCNCGKFVKRFFFLHIIGRYIRRLTKKKQEAIHADYKTNVNAKLFVQITIFFGIIFPFIILTFALKSYEPMVFLQNILLSTAPLNIRLLIYICAIYLASCATHLFGNIILTILMAAKVMQFWPAFCANYCMRWVHSMVPSETHLQSWHISLNLLISSRINHYKRLEILTAIGDQLFGTITFATHHILLLGAIIVGSFGLIRGTHVDYTTRVVFATYFILGVLIEACECSFTNHDASSQSCLRKMMRQKLRGRKFQQKRLRALRPLRMRLAGFFPPPNGQFFLTFMDVAFVNLANLLIAFEKWFVMRDKYLETLFNVFPMNEWESGKILLLTYRLHLFY